MLWACPACPDFSVCPLGWLRSRLALATDLEAVEWWQGDNLLFVGGLWAGFLPGLLVAGWQLWAAAGVGLGVRRRMQLAEAILPKLLLAAVVILIGAASHLGWGDGYRGVEMCPRAVCLAVTLTGVRAAVLFLLAASVAGLLLGGRRRFCRYSTDLVLFAVTLGLTVWVEVGA
jgi:hypothetical protein